MIVVESVERRRCDGDVDDGRLDDHDGGRGREVGGRLGGRRQRRDRDGRCARSRRRG